AQRGETFGDFGVEVFVGFFGFFAGFGDFTVEVLVDCVDFGIQVFADSVDLGVEVLVGLFGFFADCVDFVVESADGPQYERGDRNGGADEREGGADDRGDRL